VRPLYELPSKSGKKIVYNVLQVERGWQIQVFLPPAVSSADRIAVLEWLGSYRSTIRDLHPMWLTSVAATRNAFFLDVIPASTPQEVVANAIDLSSKQLSFEFAYA